jgi:hypothetical protein
MNAIPQLAIRILRGSSAGQVFRLGENAFVGTEPHCEIQLADPGIAPMHARISLRGDAYTLVDLTDASTVRVNNHVIKSRKLAVHDQIVMGDVAMEMVEFSEVSPPSSQPEAEVVVVSTEPAARTTEIKGIEEEVEEAPSEVPPYEDRMREHVTMPRPQYYRPEQAIHEKAATGTRMVRMVVVAVVVIVLGGIGAMFWTVQRAENRRIQAVYQQAVGFTEAHPDDLDGIIKTYKDAQESCSGRPGLLSDLAARIESAEALQATREREFEAALLSADKKAKELVEAQSFEEALKAYEVEGSRMRARIAAARKDVIAGLKAKVAQKAAEEKEQQEKREAELKAQQALQAKAELDKAVSGVTEAAIAGECDKALDLLDQMAKDAKFASLQDKIGEAVTSIKLLRATDATFRTTVRDDKMITPDGAPEGVPAVLDTLPPLIRAVYQIRAGDRLEAQAQLKKEEGHLLCGLLLARTQDSEDQKIENEVLQKMTKAWGKIVNDPLAKLPKPAESVTLLGQALRGGNGEQVLKAGADLLRCRNDYGKTKLVQDYEELFKAMDAIPGASLFRVSKLAGLADGRVIQVEGDTTYYAEANRDLADAKDLSIGLCKEETVYYNAADTNKAIGAWMDVYSVLPFRVLSERQLVFSLMAGQKQQTPAIGDCVLISKDIQTGRRFVAGATAKAESALVFNADFEKKLESEWRSPSPTMALDNGKLSLDVSAAEQKPKPGEGDLELNLNLGAGPLGLEFDVTRKPDAALRMTIGTLEFLIGDYEGRKAGVYVDSKLIKSAEFPRPVLGVPQHISITRSRTFVRVEVNKTGIECRLSPAAGESDVKKIVFFNDARILFDNVKVKRLSGTGETRVVGWNGDRKEVIVAKGYETEWQNVAPGKEVYFFSGKPGETNCIALAKVKEINEPWLVCSVAQGQVSGAASLVSLSADYPRMPMEGPAMAEALKPRRQSSDVLYALLKTTDGATRLILETPGNVPEKGLLHPILERIRNPQTEEVLAVVPAEPVRCEFKQEEGWITYGLLEGGAQPEISSNGVLVAKSVLPANRKIDLLPYSFSYLPGAPGAKKDFWRETSGEWKEKKGRSTGGPSLMPEGSVAASTMTEVMGDGVQCDLDVRIEKEGKPSEDDTIKAMMVELYFPARQVGVAFGVGSEKAGGLSVTGHTITQEKGPQALNRFGTLAAEARVQLEEGWGKGGPSLKTGQSYTVRVRRMKDALTFYINGKRLAHVRHPRLDGDMQLRIAAVESTLSIGKVMGIELPRSLRTPDEEPSLGEFGYVVWTEGNQILVDSDMNGIALNRKVSIMAIDKIVKGEKSKTVFLKRAALGTIVEMGPRTAKIQCTEESLPISRGMKVLPGILPASLTITDARILDLDQGL